MPINNAKNRVNQEEKYDADLDQALEVVGIGWYSLKYCFILAWLLIASLLDLTGSSLILPSAVCDLEMSDQQRGIIISIPFIGLLLTSYPWGYLVDTRGRKNMLIYSSLGSGIFSLLAGLMPNTISFAICKFISSLCIACPSTTPYIFIGEMLPSKYRDVYLSVLNSIQLAGSALVPLLAWAILPLDFRVSFGLYFFRPWRLLNIIYAIVFIVIAILLTCSPESPKFLVTQDKFDEALEVLQNMYAGNKGKKSEEFPIKKLLAPPNLTKTGNFLTTLKIQTVPLFKWSYLKWVLLNGFLLFGVYAAGNGLNLWLPDLMNRVITGNGHGGRTACEVILDRFNQTITGVTKCNDTLDQTVLLISFVARLCLTVLAVAASATVKYIGKKMLIILSMGTLGIVCISVNMITNEMLFAILLSSIAIVALAMGPINAYAMEIFPTNLRGKAVSLSMMVGRTGSVIGANWTAFMVINACELMFYSFGALLFLCSASALLLPKSKVSPQKGQLKDNGSSPNNTIYITKM